MKQNSISYIKFIVPAFIIFFVASLILYFMENSGKVKWLDYNEALVKSQNNNLPVLLYPLQSWSAKGKLANKSIFSDDSVVKFIYRNFVPAKLDIDDKAEKSFLKDRYKVENPNFTLVLDKYGRGINFLDNGWSSVMFLNFAKESLKHPFLKYKDINSCLAESAQDGKSVMLFVTNNYIQNIGFQDIINDSSMTEIIKNSFHPTVLMSFYPPDLEYLKLYYNLDDPVILSNTESIITEAIQSSKAPSEEILLLNSKNSVIKRIKLSESRDSLTAILSNFINNNK